MDHRAKAYYKQGVATAPLHKQIAMLHRKAAFLINVVTGSFASGDIEEGRTSIRTIEDLITFLRGSLDTTIPLSQTCDALYAYYYDMCVQWYIDVTLDPEKIKVMHDFFTSWSVTWENLPPDKALVPLRE